MQVSLGEHDCGTMISEKHACRNNETGAELLFLGQGLATGQMAPAHSTNYRLLVLGWGALSFWLFWSSHSHNDLNSYQASLKPFPALSLGLFERPTSPTPSDGKFTTSSGK